MRAYSKAIDSHLLKRSQEYRVLATLRYLFLREYDEMVVSESPDLQGRNSDLVIEVTIAVKEDDMKAASSFSSLNEVENHKEKGKFAKKIYSVHASLVQLDYKRVFVMRKGGGMNEEEEYKEPYIRKSERLQNIKM